MKIESVILTLPSANLEATLEFYKSIGMNIPSGIENGLLVVELPNELKIFFMNETNFKVYLNKGNKSAIMPGTNVGSIISFSVETKEDVDSIFEKVKSSKATIESIPKEEMWGYTGYFTDPNGHLVEVVWFRRG